MVASLCWRNNNAHERTQKIIESASWCVCMCIDIYTYIYKNMTHVYHDRPHQIVKSHHWKQQIFWGNNTCSIWLLVFFKWTQLCQKLTDDMATRRLMLLMCLMFAWCIQKSLPFGSLLDHWVTTHLLPPAANHHDVQPSSQDLSLKHSYISENIQPRTTNNQKPTTTNNNSEHLLTQPNANL